MTETLTAPVVEPTKQQRLVTAKASKAKPNLHVNGKRAKGKAPAKPAPKPKRGKLIDTLSPSELKHEISVLLNDLKASKDGEEKKRIRRALRIRGHMGGLGDHKAK
jgi:hypothetical protein